MKRTISIIILIATLTIALSACGMGKDKNSSFFLDLQGFSGLFSPKPMLLWALGSIVSTQSNSVDGQRCGQGSFSPKNANRFYKSIAKLLERVKSLLLPLVYHTFENKSSRYLKTQNLIRIDKEKTCNTTRAY